MARPVAVAAMTWLLLMGTWTRAQVIAVPIPAVPPPALPVVVLFGAAVTVAHAVWRYVYSRNGDTATLVQTQEVQPVPAETVAPSMPAVRGDGSQIGAITQRDLLPLMLRDSLPERVRRHEWLASQASWQPLGPFTASAGRYTVVAPTSWWGVNTWDAQAVYGPEHNALNMSLGASPLAGLQAHQLQWGIIAPSTYDLGGQEVYEAAWPEQWQYQVDYGLPCGVVNCWSEPFAGTDTPKGLIQFVETPEYTAARQQVEALAARQNWGLDIAGHHNLLFATSNISEDSRSGTFLRDFVQTHRQYYQIALDTLPDESLPPWVGRPFMRIWATYAFAYRESGAAWGCQRYVGSFRCAASGVREYRGDERSFVTVEAQMVLPAVATKDGVQRYPHRIVYVHTVHPLTTGWEWIPALADWWRNAWIGHLYGVTTQPIQVAGTELPWDAAQSDFGTASRLRDGAVVWWIAKPVEALQSLFVPQTPLTVRFERVRANIAGRFPFSLASALSVASAPSAEIPLMTGCLDLGAQLCPHEGLMAHIAQFTRGGFVVAVSFALGMWLRRRIVPEVKL